MSNSPLPRYIVHSLYGFTNHPDKNQRDDFIFITYKEGLDPQPKMRIIKDTTVEFYVTKEALRTQNIKRQTTPIQELDGYTCQEKDLSKELAKALGLRGGYHKLADLLQNIYVHGADIPSEYHVRVKYNKFAAEDAVKHGLPESLPFSIINTGALDIETSVLGGNEIILITVVDANMNCFTAIYKPFLKGASLEKVTDHVEKIFGNYPGSNDNKKSKYNLKFNFFISDDERAMMRWIFDKLHDSNLDFVSIWNMGFDIPRIISRLEFLGEDARDYFSHPKIPKDYRCLKYQVGKTRKSEHFAERWDWCHNTATFQFYDSKATFAKIRKVEGHENSYGLAYITDKYINETKLFAEQESTHHIMQSERFLDYVAYNIWDSVLLVILERNMKHVNNLVSLSQDNPLSIFAKGTVMGRNSYYSYCKEQGQVLCSVRGDISTEYDDEIPALGGAVLNPNLALDTGVNFLFETDRLSMVQEQAKDIDAKSMYPNIGMTINDSRDTVIYTVMSVNGKKEDVEDFCTNYVDTKENAVYLGSKYFNLPTLEEMERLYDEKRIA